MMSILAHLTVALPLWVLAGMMGKYVRMHNDYFWMCQELRAMGIDPR